MAPIPTLAELRRLVESQGVTPTDEDLDAVVAFLEVLLPAFHELESLIPPETVPAGLFLPVEGR